MKTFVLVDFANLAHRCKHVTMGDAATKAGMALHICFNSFRQVWRKFGANHIVVCLEGRSWRRDVYPDYKAHRRVQAALKTRSEREDDEFYFEVMNRFTEFLSERTNVTVLQQDGVEGDDLVARWIDLHPADSHVILSSDSDFYQLLAPNVTIYDGIKSWTITPEKVLDEKDQPATKSKTVKEKIELKNGKTKEVKKIIIESVQPPHPEYELFKKIVRGDATDNIMSANPGVLEKGSKKKPGIIQAFADRHDRGFIWNDFMQREWVDHEGNTIRVLDAYKRNENLINLRLQPDNVKDLMDVAIVAAVQKPQQTGVGIWFLRFCNEMDLHNIAKNPKEYAEFLTVGYSKPD